MLHQFLNTDFYQASYLRDNTFRIDRSKTSGNGQDGKNQNYSECQKRFPLHFLQVYDCKLLTYTVKKQFQFCYFIPYQFEN